LKVDAGVGAALELDDHELSRTVETQDIEPLPSGFA
jgi:hypothetical protein